MLKSSHEEKNVCAPPSFSSNFNWALFTLKILAGFSDFWL